jgi:hypothetical protein
MSAKEDLDRTLELKRIVYGKLAKELMRDRNADHVLAVTSIEGHKGRQEKAIRLLGDTVGNSFIRLDQQRVTHYGSPKKETFYQVNKFDTDSAQYGRAPEFDTTWQQLHDEIFSSIYNPQVENVGYQRIYDLENSKAIYVYWNQDEYDFSSDDHGPLIYPKALREIRIKSILHAIIENHFNDDFGSKMEHYLGLPANSIKREDTFDMSIRNFCARSAHFTTEKYYGVGGFMAEYEHYRNYFEALISNFHKIDTIIKSHGGHDVIVKEMRCDTMRQLLEDAPLNLSFEGDETRPIRFYDDETQKKWRTKQMSTFILAHANYFDYDLLYDTDTSIAYIEMGRASTFGPIDEDKRREKHAWNYQQNEKEFVNTFLQERTKCLTKVA